MKHLVNEDINLNDKVHKLKSGDGYTIVYVDNKISENTFEMKEKFANEYGMVYLPSKLGKYAPHCWGWIMWKGESDPQYGLVKKFLEDLPNIETTENGEGRGFDERTGNLSEVVRQILADVEATKNFTARNSMDADVKRKIEEFENMLENELGNEKTQEFLASLINYRSELRKHNQYELGWTNTLLAFLYTNGKATVVRPEKEWEQMGYLPKEGSVPIPLIGTGRKYTRYSKQQKERIIQKYLDEHNVDSYDELPESSKYDLKNRRLRGIPVAGSEYNYCYKAYDISEMVAQEGAETEPDEPDTDNWWWNRGNENEKDINLTNAVIAFAESEGCGNLKVNTDNSRQDLNGARGNATNAGEINLINDGKLRFPTAVHELTHQLRHWAVASTNNPSLARFYDRHASRELREQEAELCAAFVVKEYGYDIQPHLNYISNWGLGKANCRAVFDQIASLADYIDKGIKSQLKLKGTNI